MFEHIVFSILLPVIISITLLFFLLKFKIANQISVLKAVSLSIFLSFSFEVGFYRLIPESVWHYFPWLIFFSTFIAWLCFLKIKQSIFLFFAIVFICTALRYWELPDITLKARLLVLFFMISFVLFLVFFYNKKVYLLNCGIEWFLSSCFATSVLAFLTFQGHFAQLTMVLISTFLTMFLIIILLRILKVDCDYLSTGYFVLVFSFFSVLVSYAYNFGDVPLICYLLVLFTSLCPFLVVYIKVFRKRFLVVTVFSIIISVFNVLYFLFTKPPLEIY